MFQKDDALAERSNTPRVLHAWHLPVQVQQTVDQRAHALLTICPWMLPNVPRILLLRPVALDKPESHQFSTIQRIQQVVVSGIKNLHSKNRHPASAFTIAPNRMSFRF